MHRLETSWKVKYYLQLQFILVTIDSVILWQDRDEQARFEPSL